MYNLRSRGRVTPAGSARPHLGMGARALPAVASQVTPSQAVAMLEDEMVPETELIGDEVVICETFDDDEIRSTLGYINATELEATQPPILSPIYLEDLIIVNWFGDSCEEYGVCVMYAVYYCYFLFVFNPGRPGISNTTKRA